MNPAPPGPPRLDAPGGPTLRSDYLARRASRAYLLVSMASMLAASLGVMVDTVVIGRYLGHDALAGISLINPLYLLSITLGGLLASGASTRCAEHIGAGHPAGVHRVFTLTLLVAVLTGLPLTALIMAGPERVAVALGARDALVPGTAEFLRGLAPATLPIMLTLILTALLRLDNSRGLSLLAIGLMTVANVGFDLLVVKVWPDLGLRGIGLATSASYLLSVLVCALHFLKRHKQLGFARLRGMDGELRALLQTGLPEGLWRFCIAARTHVVNHLLMAIGGPGAVAVHASRIGVYYLTTPLNLGVANALTPVAGIFFGEQDPRALRGALAHILRVGLLVNVAAAALIVWQAEAVARLFGADGGGLFAAHVRGIRYFALSMPLLSLNLALLKFYQTTRQLRLANLISAAEGFVLMVGLCLLLAPGLGVDGIWLAFALAEVTLSILLAGYLGLRQRRWPGRLRDWMRLPRDFGGRPEDLLDLSIGNSLEQVVDISQRVGEFCASRGLDERRGFVLALAIEEMAGNVVRHAFRPGEPRFMDIRVLLKGERVILRLRDDGARFNPFEFLAGQDPDDQVSNIGIRMVHRLARSMDYRYSIGLNYLIITL